MVTTVKSAQEFKEALNHDGLVVVDFFATWCGPCKMIAPLLEKFSVEYPSAKFIKVDVDELSTVAQEYEVSSMPTLLFFKGGKIVQTVVGANPGAIKQAIASNV
jgi:thioredoxin 1